LFHSVKELLDQFHWQKLRNLSDWGQDLNL